MNIFLDFEPDFLCSFSHKSLPRTVLRICFYFSMPENPINARDISPAVISEIGFPFIAAGISALSNRSRAAAISTNASAKPSAPPMPLAIASKRVYPLSMFSIVTPKTAQFVVISGRYTPRLLYNDGIVFLRNTSTS